jgi:SAM-dependent methyltransferase
MLTGSLSSTAVLAAFAEPFVEGRRVLVFGNSLSMTPRLLIERGARAVHVCDSTPLRAAEASERADTPGLAFSSFADDTLVGRDGSFDCVLVEHLGSFDARSVIARARRLLAPRGVALFATPNRDAVTPLLPPPEPSASPLDYYALYDLVAGEFEHVRMLGQAPFVGYAVVDFRPEGTPEPVIDSEFLPRGSEEPELFVALAARQKTNLAAYAVVQLPLQRVLGLASGARAADAVSRTAESPAPIVPSELQKKLNQQESWIAELEARAETADARADQAEDNLSELETRLAATIAELETQRAEFDLERGRMQAHSDEKSSTEAAARDLGALLTERDATIVKLDAALLERDTALAASAAKLAEREAALAGEKARLLERDARLAQRDERVAQLEARLAERDAQIRELTEAGPGDTSELDAAERGLRDRGKELRRLERDLAEAERVGKELVRELLAARSADVDERLTVLARQLAESEADRIALGWAAQVRSAGTAN